MQENFLQIRKFNERYIKHFQFQFHFTFNLFITVGGRNIQQQMATQIHNFQIFYQNIMRTNKKPTVQSINQFIESIIQCCTKLFSKCRI